MKNKSLQAAVREALRKKLSKAGKASAKSLTPDERKARARAAGIASGKARQKKAGKK